MNVSLYLYYSSVSTQDYTTAPEVLRLNVADGTGRGEPLTDEDTLTHCSHDGLRCLGWLNMVIQTVCDTVGHLWSSNKLSISYVNIPIWI